MVIQESVATAPLSTRKTREAPPPLMVNVLAAVPALETVPMALLDPSGPSARSLGRYPPALVDPLEWVEGQGLVFDSARRAMMLGCVRPSCGRPRSEALRFPSS